MINKKCFICQMVKSRDSFRGIKNKNNNKCKLCENEYHRLRRLKKYNGGESIIPLKEVVNGVLIVEEWKDIYGYEGLYQISNFGRVKTLCRKKVLFDKIKKLWVPTNWYPIVNLCDRNGKKERKDVHALVAKHFISNPENKREVNHKSGIKSNNKVWELEWSTHKDNIQHAFDNGLCSQVGARNAKHKLTESQVLEIFNSKTIKAKDMKTLYGVQRCVYYQIKSGKTWGHLTSQ